VILAFRAAQFPPGAALGLGSLGTGAGLGLGAFEEEEDFVEVEQDEGKGRDEVEAVGVWAGEGFESGGATEGMLARERGCWVDQKGGWL